MHEWKIARLQGNLDKSEDGEMTFSVFCLIIKKKVKL